MENKESLWTINKKSIWYNSPVITTTFKKKKRVFKEKIDLKTIEECDKAFKKLLKDLKK